jgi:uncharacterized protein YegP (UPF0339 family)
MAGQFRITSSPDGLHVFTLVADNQRQLVQSVLHRSREQLLEAMELVRQAAAQAPACECASSLDGQHYFQLRDATGQLLASSALYRDLQALKADIDELMRVAAEASSVEVPPAWHQSMSSRSRSASDPMDEPPRGRSRARSG